MSGSARIQRAPTRFPNLEVRPPSEDVENVISSNFTHGRDVGPRTMPMSDLAGGVRLDDPEEIRRVAALSRQMSAPGGYISRPIVDTGGNVIEGQHRLEAMRQLGMSHAPVHVVQDLAGNIDIPRLHAAMRAAQPLHSDHRHQLTQMMLENLADEGSPAKVREGWEAPRGFEKAWHAGLNHLEAAR